MGFFKNLFGNRNSKEELFIPTPKQTIPGLEPIVVHAIEHLYPDIEEQQYAFAYLLQNTEENDVLIHLSLVRIGVRNLEKIIEQNPSLTIRYAVYSESGFTNMKAAKKWVASITKSPK